MSNTYLTFAVTILILHLEGLVKGGNLEKDDKRKITSIPQSWNRQTWCGLFIVKCTKLTTKRISRPFNGQYSRKRNKFSPRISLTSHTWFCSPSFLQGILQLKKLNFVRRNNYRERYVYFSIISLGIMK